MDLKAAMLASINPDMSARREAETTLMNASRDNAPAFVETCLEALQGDDPTLSQLAAILLKNLVRKQWELLEAPVRGRVQLQLMTTLGSTSTSLPVLRALPMTIACVAVADHKHGFGADVVEAILESLQHTEALSEGALGAFLRCGQFILEDLPTPGLAKLMCTSAFGALRRFTNLSLVVRCLEALRPALLQTVTSPDMFAEVAQMLFSLSSSVPADAFPHLVDIFTAFLEHDAALLQPIVLQVMEWGFQVLGVADEGGKVAVACLLGGVADGFRSGSLTGSPTDHMAQVLALCCNTLTPGMDVDYDDDGDEMGMGLHESQLLAAAACAGRWLAMAPPPELEDMLGKLSAFDGAPAVFIALVKGQALRLVASVSDDVGTIACTSLLPLLSTPETAAAAWWAMRAPPLAAWMASSPLPVGTVTLAALSAVAGGETRIRRQAALTIRELLLATHAAEMDATWLSTDMISAVVAGVPDADVADVFFATIAAMFVASSPTRVPLLSTVAETTLEAAMGHEGAYAGPLVTRAICAAIAAAAPKLPEDFSARALPACLAMVEEDVTPPGMEALLSVTSRTGYGTDGLVGRLMPAAVAAVRDGTPEAPLALARLMQHTSRAALVPHAAGALAATVEADPDQQLAVFEAGATTLQADFEPWFSPAMGALTTAMEAKVSTATPGGVTAVTQVLTCLLGIVRGFASTGDAAIQLLNYTAGVCTYFGKVATALAATPSNRVAVHCLEVVTVLVEALLPHNANVVHMLSADVDFMVVFLHTAATTEAGCTAAAAVTAALTKARPGPKLP